MTPDARIIALINGFQVSQAISVVATLGIADLLRDGARDCQALAAAAHVHSPSLYRLLRALAAVGIFHEDNDRQFSLTPLGEHLRSDASCFANALARLLGRPMYAQAWSGLLESIQTGEIAFDKVHGMSVWKFRAQKPDEGAAFDRAMAAITDQIAAAVLSVYDFARHATVVDVGGGQGAFVARILAANPTTSGTLFDQAHVVASAKELLCSAGVSDRCKIVGGDFFKAVPEGGDVYLLKSILHDWNDEDAIAILRSCRRAIRSNGRLIIVEDIVGPCNEGLEGKIMDLNMMVITGGVERTREEYAAILQAASFRLARVVPTNGAVNIIEATPVCAPASALTVNSLTQVCHYVTHGNGEGAA
jgi:O-methyltransferase domain/Dimerisation domain